METTEKKLLNGLVRKNGARKTFCIRILDEEKDKMQILADKYTGGSLSDWIRQAALHWTPSDKDFE